jgi:hypothetical protein
MSLSADAKAARAAADKSVKSGDPKERQRELAAAAIKLEQQVEFEDWVKIQEDAGYTVVGDSFETAMVAEAAEGPTFNDKPGAVDG